MEKQAFTLQLKSLSAEGVFQGYASVFENIDQQYDKVVRGAFVEQKARDVKLLWQHRSAEPLGKVLELREDDIGLNITAQLLMKLQRAQEAYELLQHEVINGLSIGYVPTDYHIEESGIRVLTKVKLWEISLVTFPANEEARVTAVKESQALEEAIYRAQATLRAKHRL